MALIVFLVFGVSVYLFKKAAGTFRLDRINIVSYTFYLFLLQSMIGVLLVNLGFTEHYTFSYFVQSKEKILRLVTYAVCITSILWPLVIIATERIFKVNAVCDIEKYHEKKIDDTASRGQFLICVLSSILCTACMIGYLLKIGYIPLLKLIHIGANVDFATERTRIATLYFIHPVVTNVLVLVGIPLLSYLSFAFAIIRKEKKWIILSGILFVFSLVTKTYNFSKAPVVFHLFIYIIIFTAVVKIPQKILTVLYCILICMMMLMYQLTSGISGLTDIYNGILGRTFFSQIGTLGYVFDAFPKYLPFLNGRSIDSAILGLLGIDPDLHVRSAKIIVDFYWPDRVYDGIAGVLNSLFIGEAFANFNWAGMLASIVWVGVYMGIFYVLMIKLKKNAVTIAGQATLASQIANATQGGFFDFVYSVGLTVIILFFVVFYLIPFGEKQFNNRLEERRKVSIHRE